MNSPGDGWKCFGHWLATRPDSGSKGVRHHELGHRPPFELVGIVLDLGLLGSQRCVKYGRGNTISGQVDLWLACVGQAQLAPHGPMVSAVEIEEVPADAQVGIN